MSAQVPEGGFFSYPAGL